VIPWNKKKYYKSKNNWQMALGFGKGNQFNAVSIKKLTFCLHRKMFEEELLNLTQKVFFSTLTISFKI
jgi:hypothetical protein